ncbi:MAG: hypothetical protein Q7R62_03730 [bacterium]|nr:hypothetical protein [bacterium]
MLTLTPRLVIVSGMGVAGKSSIAQGLVRRIANAVFLGRDRILYGGLMFVNENESAPELPAFADYVSRDNVFPANCEIVETPFGQMTSVFHDASPAFYRRHGKEQSYLVAGRVAEDNLALGKVPVVEGFLTRHWKAGTLQAFVRQAIFAPYPVRIIHVEIDLEEAYKRMLVRAKTDSEAAIRARPLLDKDAFMAHFRKVFQLAPTELGSLPHLLLNSTVKSVEQCVQEAFDYVCAD